MFRTLWFYIKFFIGLVMLEPVSARVERLKEKEGEEAYEKEVTKTVKNWCVNRIKETGATVYVHGGENLPDRNVLFICNHMSNLDFAVLLAKINKPFGFIAKVELEKIPMLSKWMRKINCLFMDRSDMKQQLQVIVEGIKMLKNGKSLLIFPEGTRSRDGKIHEFKAGSFKLAIKSGVPIVPLTIMGTSDIYEGNGNILKKGDVHLYIHDPIYMENISKEEMGSLHKMVEDIVREPFNK